MIIHRGSNHHIILTEGNKYTAVVSCILSCQSQIYGPIQYTVNSVGTVCLLGMEIYIRIHSAKTCEKFRKEIRRRNGGGCQINDLLSGTGEILQKIVADIQNAESAVVELVYHTFL